MCKNTLTLFYYAIWYVLDIYLWHTFNIVSRNIEPFAFLINSFIGLNVKASKDIIFNGIMSFQTICFHVTFLLSWMWKPVGIYYAMEYWHDVFEKNTWLYLHVFKTFWSALL